MTIHGTATGELQAARRIASRAGVVEHRVVRVPDLREAADIKDGPLSGGRVPATYIPMKNAIFYGLAGAFADETGAEAIIGGHNKDDKRIFEDAGDRFFASLQSAFQESSPRLAKVRIVRPLKLYTKPEVVVLAAKLGVPLELTWSCHMGGARPCWRCEGCRGRVSSFKAAGVTDPLALKKV